MLAYRFSGSSALGYLEGSSAICSNLMFWTSGLLVFSCMLYLVIFKMKAIKWRMMMGDILVM